MHTNPMHTLVCVVCVQGKHFTSVFCIAYILNYMLKDCKTKINSQNKIAFLKKSESDSQVQPVVQCNTLKSTCAVI